MSYSFPIPTAYLPVVNQEVAKLESLLKGLVGYPVKVMIRINAEELNESLIQNLVCEEFDVTWQQIKGKDRLRNVTDARHIYCYLCRIYLNKTLSGIGLSINRDHTTVTHAVQNIQNYLMAGDKRIVQAIEYIEKQIKK